MFLTIVLCLYGLISWGIAFYKIGYMIRCSVDKKFRAKQPILWKDHCVIEVILYASLLWLPVLVLKTVIDALLS